MKKLFFIIFIQNIFFIGCADNKTTKPSTAVGTGREFIRASLDGNFNKAQEFLFQDKANKQFFESYKAYYNRLSLEKKQKYKEASFEINNLLELNDSTVIINYSNSYMNKPMEIKVIRKDNEWVVDFLYTSSGNLPIN